MHGQTIVVVAALATALAPAALAQERPDRSGEVSMDGGSTWHPFFGMTLRRTVAAGEAR